MKVLMFGWEFPPHISGGLGTACFGLTQALSGQDVKVWFVVPRFFGGEKRDDPVLINASSVALQAKKASHSRIQRRAHRTTYAQSTDRLPSSDNISFIEVPARISPYNTSSASHRRTENIAQWNYAMTPRQIQTENDDELCTVAAAETRSDEDAPSSAALYGANLMQEIRAYAAAASVIARTYTFDVIHAHDWMTFQAGISAKRATGKPLVVHVHSTEFDRAGERVNREVFEVEKLGFEKADKIITVSNWTKNIVMSRYGIPAEKIQVIYNGIMPKESSSAFTFPDIGSHFVTFLGRVTHQKGPGYFVEAAQKVLQEFPDAHFIVAGAGDLLPQTIERVAALNMSANFHFTGFLKGEQVDQVWSLTDVYVMPSVSEPFGIAPLEAIQGDVPVILSNQSGVSEVMPHAIKVDFWDTKSLAAAICSVLRYESLSHLLRQNSKRHIQQLTWDKAASALKALYHELITDE